MPADLPAPALSTLPPMPARMKAGLRAFRFLARFMVLLVCLNLVNFLWPSYRSDIGKLIPFLMLLPSPPILMLLFVCLWGIQRGKRIIAILALLFPIFLSLPLITECIVLGSLLFSDSNKVHIWGIILFRLLMLVVLVTAWPLAFGATTKEWHTAARQWYRQKNRAGSNDAEQFLAELSAFFFIGYIRACLSFCFSVCSRLLFLCLKYGEKCLGAWRARWRRYREQIRGSAEFALFSRLPSFFARGFNACFEKCFGKQHAQWKRRQARIHAEAARALFEAATALRQRKGMPIESVIASYEDIERRYGEDEAPAVREWVERALQEKNAILRARSG
jgi:hypothetical protein